jgi:hypothetical protein
MEDNKTRVLSELFVPGVIPESGNGGELNTGDVIRRLHTEYSEMKELVVPGKNSEEGVSQGIEIEIIAFDDNDPRMSLV